MIRNSTDIFVSIVVPVFNRDKYIKETIQSVLSQTYSNWELILIDDGSSDQSISICQEFVLMDDRIRFFERKENPKGASTCRNIGIRESKHEWIIFLDSDDLLGSWCLKQRVEKIILSDSVFDFLVFPMLLFKHKMDDLMILQNIQTSVHPLDRFLQRENVWLMSSIIWRKEFLNGLGGYRKEASSFQDWEMNVRALAKSDKWFFYDEAVPDNFYRQHEQTISSTRFSVDHLTNNVETFVLCFSILRESIKYTERRREYFVALIFEWLKRFSGLVLKKEERFQIRKKYLKECLEAKMLLETEYKEILRFFRLGDMTLFLRLRFLGNRLESKLYGKLPYLKAEKLVKKQGLYKYDKKLP